jgi:hypothetical protein
MREQYYGFAVLFFFVVFGRVLPCHTEGRFPMGSRQRAVMSLSVSPDTAKEYREIAKAEGKTVSGLFRDIFSFYKQEKLKKEFCDLQDYGTGQIERLNITEKEIERLIFKGR